MSPEAPDELPSIEADLVAWGKVIVLETVGRTSGQPRRVTVGYIPGPNDQLLVAASDEATQWARNLLADPHCKVEHRGAVSLRIAEPLSEDESHAVTTGLILRYGTPAERQSGGPAFRLLPVASGAAPSTATSGS